MHMLHSRIEPEGIVQVQQLAILRTNGDAGRSRQPRQAMQDNRKRSQWVS